MMIIKTYIDLLSACFRKIWFMVAMFCLGGCQNSNISKSNTGNDTYQHSVIFDTSSEADTRLMQSVQTMQGEILKFNLSGNDDYDLMRLWEIYQNGIADIAKTALSSLENEKLKVSAVSIISTSTLGSSLTDSIFLYGDTANYDPSNRQAGLGEKIAKFKEVIETDTSLPSSFDHQFAALMITQLKNSTKLSKIIQQHSTNTELNDLTSENQKVYLAEIKLLQKALAQH